MSGARSGLPVDAGAHLAGSATALILECRGTASRLRDLSFTPDVTPVIEDQQALEASVSQALDREMPPDRLELRRLELAAFGLIPADFALRPFLQALYTEQLGGYYDPRRKRMVIVHKPASSDVLAAAPDPEAAGPYAQVLNRLRLQGVTQEKIFLVHELVHALQDAHLTDLQTFLEPGERGPGAPIGADQRQARRALVEGDATFVMTQYMLGDAIDLAAVPGVAENALGAVEEGGLPGTRVLASGPAVFRENLLFSYFYGMDFVGRLLREGGWQIVNRAFASPPATTEQVFHPQRYLEGEPARIVTLPPLPALEGQGYTPALEGEQGELGIRTLFVSTLGRARSALAAAGWGGDRYRIYRRDGHRPLVVWASSWDTATDAAELVDALEQHARAWQDRPALFSWDRQGDEVVVLIGDDPGLEAQLPALGAEVRIDVHPPAPPPLLSAPAGG